MRAVVLPLVALLASAALLGGYAVAGGIDYPEVQPPADPCRDRAGLQRSVPPRIEAVAERVVLLGLDEAACSLGVSRERLVLALPAASDRRALAAELGVSERRLAEALKAGLSRSVARLDQGGRLPPASRLLPSVLAELDLPGPARTLLEAIPGDTLDSFAPTGPILRRAVDDLDVQTLLARLDDPERLEAQLRDAVAQAAQDEIRARLVARLPGSVRGLLGE